MRRDRKLDGCRAIAAGVALVALACALLPAAQAEVVTGGNARLSFRGWISPQTLPRTGTAPIALHLAGTVTPLNGQRPETLDTVTIEINRHGVVDTHGLPTCSRKRLESTTTEQAMAVCGDALVGVGHFTSHIDIPEQAPFPAEGKMLAFNSRIHGHTTLVGHVYGTRPVPVSQVLQMSFNRSGRGAFGSTVSVKMPQFGPEWGYVTGFDLTLDRRFRWHGRDRSLLSASCPAPPGVSEAPFKAARGTYLLHNGESFSRVLGGSCKVTP